MRGQSHLRPKARPNEKKDELMTTHDRFPLTDMPTWLMLTLAGLGLPRTILADLDVVAPESSPVYYVLALAPFAVWLVVAVGRRSAKPFMDFLVLGCLYGLSLVAVHQVLWDVAISRGHRPSAAAVDFAQQFGSAHHELALRGYTVMVALAIGVGSGLVAALVAVVARAWSARSTRSAVSGTGTGAV
jgi:hypothetical protein